MPQFLNQVMMWKKKIFFFWCATWGKLNLSQIYFNSPEGQKSCDSFAKGKFVRDTFWKLGAMWSLVWKNTEASRNCCIIYLNSNKHWIYNESWLNNKIEKLWHLFVCAFISLMLLLFSKIVFICCHHVGPNGFSHISVMHAKYILSLLVFNTWFSYMYIYLPIYLSI